MSWYGQVQPTGGTLTVQRRGVKRPRPYNLADNPRNNLGTGSKKGKMVRSYSRTVTRRKKKGRRFGGRRINRGIPTLWPRFKLVKFKVVSPFSRTSGGGVGLVDVVNLSANSLADPHNLLGSNLPLGLDQWAAMYSRYVVIGSKHYVKVHNLTSTGAIAYGLTLRQPGLSGALSSAAEYLEQPMTVSKMLSPDVDHSGLGMSYNAKRYWHVRKFMDHDELHGVLSTTPGDPANLCYVQFWTEDVNRTQDFTVEGYATSIYTVLLFEPINPSRSSL